jgi:hypothetical protein
MYKEILNYRICFSEVISKRYLIPELFRMVECPFHQLLLIFDYLCSENKSDEKNLFSDNSVVPVSSCTVFLYADTYG